MTTSDRAGDSGGFAVRDWLLVAAVALMWGSSFLLIKLGVHGLAPATVAWLRLLFGAAALAVVPAARAPLRRRRDRSLVALLGLTWMAVPFVLFPLAERSIPSALAGMINGAAPLFTAAFAAVWSRRRPNGTLLAGLVIGFGGVLAVNLPAVGGGASLAGIGLVLLATVLYGVAFNLAEPLENRNGPLPVIWRAQLLALAIDTPAGVAGLVHSTPHLSGLAAMAALGVLSTGAAFAAFTTLIARVGATRASVTVYLVPVVAIGLGASASSEPIAPLSLAGIALVLLGAYLTGRRVTPPTRSPKNQPAPEAARPGQAAAGLPASFRLRAFLGGKDGVAVGLGPFSQHRDGVDEGAAEVGELVFDPGRGLGVGMPGYQPAAFQPAQRVGEHLAGDPADQPGQLTPAMSPARSCSRSDLQAAQIARDAAGPHAGAPPPPFRGGAPCPVHPDASCCYQLADQGLCR